MSAIIIPRGLCGNQKKRERMCVDCRHAHKTDDGLFCISPHAVKSSPVDGTCRANECWLERETGVCADNGAFFEPKDTP